MNQGVEIILKRMDSNPDEFQISKSGNAYPEPYEPERHKWNWVTQQILQRVNERESRNITQHPYGPPLPFLSDEEITTLYTKLMLVQGQSFVEQVLRTLVGEEEKDQRNMADAAGLATHHKHLLDMKMKSAQLAQGSLGSGVGVVFPTRSPK